MSDNPEVLKIDVSETIKIKDIPPGNPAPSMKDKEEALPPEEVAKRQKIMVEYTRLSGRYVEPHNKKARWVKKEDLPVVLADGSDMVAMCNLSRGNYSSIAALSHPQIDNKDPLRFFVMPNGMVIINPVITDHTKAPIFKNEACMSYPFEEIKTMVPRYNKITVTYQTLQKEVGKGDPILSKPVTEALTGGPAHVFQHKIGHLNGCNIFDKDYAPEKSVGLGDGLPVDPNMWDEVKEAQWEEIKVK